MYRMAIKCFNRSIVKCKSPQWQSRDVLGSGRFNRSIVKCKCIRLRLFIAETTSFNRSIVKCK